MSTFWSPSAPGKQKPGGASWWSELISAFGLDLTLAMSMGVTSESMARLGLSVSPEVAMAAMGVSAGQFSLAFSPALGMVIPVPIAASLELPLTPSIRMHAAEQYARSLGLSIPPSIAAAGAGKSNALLGLSLTPGFAMGGVGVNAAVAFDAVGLGATGGSGGTTATVTWSHTAHGAVLVGIEWSQAIGRTPAPTRTVTYGGVPMTSLAVIGLSNMAVTAAGTFIELFGLLTPTLGSSQAVVATVTSTATQAFSNLQGSSVSYTGVNSFGTPVTHAAVGAALAVGVPTTSGHMVATLFGGTAPGGGAIFSSITNATVRFNQNVSPAIVLADGSGTGTLSITANAGTGNSVAGIGIDLST